MCGETTMRRSQASATASLNVPQPRAPARQSDRQFELERSRPRPRRIDALARGNAHHQSSAGRTMGRSCAGTHRRPLPTAFRPRGSVRTGSRSRCRRWRPRATETHRAAGGAAGCRAAMAPTSLSPGATEGARPESLRRGPARWARRIQQCRTLGPVRVESARSASSRPRQPGKHHGQRLVWTPLALAQALHAARCAHRRPVVTADARAASTLPALSTRRPRRWLPRHICRRRPGSMKLRCGRRSGTRSALRGIDDSSGSSYSRGTLRRARSAPCWCSAGRTAATRSACSVSALCAVDERVTVAPVGGIREFAHAVVAREEIRGHRNLRPVRRAALSDDEAAIDRGLPAGDLADRGLASGGARLTMSVAKAATPAVVPHTTTSTSRACCARIRRAGARGERKTNGRKPTPAPCRS